MASERTCTERAIAPEVLNQTRVNRYRMAKL